MLLKLCRNAMLNEDIESNDDFDVQKRSLIKRRGFSFCRFDNFIISHDGKFKTIWDWMVLMLVIFTAIQVPYFAAFSTMSPVIFDIDKQKDIAGIVVVAAVVDMIFIFDIFLNFRTTYLRSKSETVEKNAKKIARHYLKTWFLIDLLAAIPFDWIMHNHQPSGSHTSTLIGLLKSARLLRLFRVARKLDRYSEYGVAVLFLSMCFFALLAHWLACIWNYIAVNEEGLANSWVRRLNNELYPDENGIRSSNSTALPPIRMSQGERYIASVYFIVSSLTSVGFGNIAATTMHEQIFSVIVMLLGALMYACIFGNMVAIVQRIYARATHYHTQMNNVREFLRHHKIPHDLQNNINNYVRREWIGNDALQALDSFPYCLQADVTYHLYQQIFYSVPVFREATVSCMRAMSMKFKTMTLQSNIYILRTGEEIDNFYIVGRGEIEMMVVVEGEPSINKLGQNETFGYDFKTLPNKPKSSTNVRTSILSDIHFIAKDDLMEIFHTYPRFADSFRETCQHGFDLNDTEQEGYFSTPVRKPKSHMSLMAKQALSMPFINKISRYSQRKRRSSFTGGAKVLSENCLLDQRYRVHQNGSVSSERDSLSKSYEEISNISSNGYRKAKPKLRETLSDNTALLNRNGLQTQLPNTIPRCNIAAKKTLGQKDDDIECRLGRLEDQMEMLRESTDAKLNNITNLLLSLKGKQEHGINDVHGTNSTNKIGISIDVIDVNKKSLLKDTRL